jgi:hypothetical protein
VTVPEPLSTFPCHSALPLRIVILASYARPYNFTLLQTPAAGYPQRDCTLVRPGRRPGRPAFRSSSDAPVVQFGVYRREQADPRMLVEIVAVAYRPGLGAALAE